MADSSRRFIDDPILRVPISRAQLGKTQGIALAPFRARETVTWKVRTTSPDTGAQIDGTSAVTFRGGKIVRFILGPRPCL